MKTDDIEHLSHQWLPVADILSPLKTNQDYEEARSLLDQLIDTVGANENHPLSTLMYSLGILIDDFKKSDDALETLGTKGDAISTINFLMDQHGLKQADLSDIFGSQGNVSVIIPMTQYLFS